MSKLDVRTMETTSVEAVVFAEEYAYVGSQLSSSGGYIYLEDVDGDMTSKVRREDIDNLILALQKAKEIWA